MGLRSWLSGETSEDEPDDFTRLDAILRAQDPDFDEKRRTHMENHRLRERRDMLAQQEQNILLAQEIRLLEARAAQRGERNQ